jgi:hypothetical protein
MLSDRLCRESDLTCRASSAAVSSVRRRWLRDRSCSRLRKGARYVSSRRFEMRRADRRVRRQVSRNGRPSSSMGAQTYGHAERQPGRHRALAPPTQRNARPGSVGRLTSRNTLLPVSVRPKLGERATVMTKVEEYRARAQECELRANQVRDREARQWFLELARQWHHMADQWADLLAERGR